MNNKSEIPDEDLLKRWESGDVAAMALLYERYRDRIFKFVYMIVRDKGWAEDITHDCFEKFMDRPELYESVRGPLYKYFRIAARNRAYEHFRKRYGERALDDSSEEMHFVVEQQQLLGILEKERRDVLNKALDYLTPLQREALIMYKDEELTLAEIAEIVGTDVGTVKSRINRALKQLRERVTPYFNIAEQIINRGDRHE